MKAARLIGIIYLALFIWLVIVFGLFINAPGYSSVGIDFGQALYNFYYYGGIPLAGFACVVVFTFIGGKAASVLSQYFFWGVMLFAFNYSSLFFANAFNLSMMTFLQGFTWLSDYLPSLVLCATLVAMLSCWGRENKKIVNAIAWIGTLFSAFMAGYVIFYIAGVIDVTLAASRSSGIFQIVHAVIVPVCIAWCFCLTRNSEIFAQTFSLKLNEQKKG